MDSISHDPFQHLTLLDWNTFLFMEHGTIVSKHQVHKSAIFMCNQMDYNDS